ncbi:hypothetical protein AVEN_215101-1 [Araneus ventricosus]|uniref:Reverse transcriptase domain-containing protein n=1 Tax=Araneus ventricosus TaxID=182803 RepID=A0A4Y2K8F0_ARAVE|nr:hypothetical protein AVEN_215101-1 [Araneus ventricosus]
MDALKQKRSTLRSAFKRSANNLEVLLAATQLKASDMEINFEQISERFKQLKEYVTKLLELLQKKNCTSDEYEKEYTTCESYEDKFIALKIKVKNVLAGDAKNRTDLLHYTDTASKCKLPEIQLPTFDGNPREWLNFWTQFQKIHEEASIDERDKYQYLIQSTVPGSTPREIVESFPATAENYKKAVEYLKERFGKESVLVQVYIRDLLQLVISKNKCELSTLYDKLQTRIWSLDSLGLAKDKCADILYPLIESTLPVDIVKMWDRQKHLVQDTQGKSDLDLLMDFVKNEVDSEFRVKISREIFNTGKITNKKVEKDRDYLPFLWLRQDDLEQVEEYRHRRVVFGLTCSPYLLAATLQCHLNRVQENLSCTSEILKTAFYVDNCVTSLDSELEMRKFILESQIIMSSDNFNLRGWKSNFHSIVPNGDTSTDENVSVLGLVWHMDTDTLSCKIEQTVTLEKPITKRLVLAIAHQIFDPTGFTTPVMLIPKLILQETWNLKLKWDDTLPDDLVRKFKSWYRQLYLIANIRVPRWFSISPTTESLSVHVFCDASQKAYATCIFLRVNQGDKIVVTLVYARSRVAPVKTVTIPRLELLACLIGARLLSSVINDLKLYDVNIYCCTDSTTALCWIQRDQNWATFVQNRVREIRSLTSPTVWRHVPGALNAADLISRGCSGEQLLQGKW